MRRTLITRVPGRYAVAYRADAVNQRTTELVQLHYFGLLGRYDIIKFMQ
jgi:hypothetical protein